MNIGVYRKWRVLQSKGNYEQSELTADSMGENLCYFYLKWLKSK